MMHRTKSTLIIAIIGLLMFSWIPFKSVLAYGGDNNVGIFETKTRDSNALMVKSTNIGVADGDVIVEARVKIISLDSDGIAVGGWVYIGFDTTGSTEYGYGFYITTYEGNPVVAALRPPTQGESPPFLTDYYSFSWNTWTILTIEHDATDSFRFKINGLTKETDTLGGHFGNSISKARIGELDYHMNYIATKFEIDYLYFKHNNVEKFLDEFDDAVTGWVATNDQLQWSWKGNYNSPQIGLEPRQKYPFVYDPNLNVDPFYIRWLDSQPQDPPRGTVYSSGKWYPGLWGKTTGESYAYVTNGKAYLKAVVKTNDPFEWGGATINQGRIAHLGVQAGKFKGSNDTSANSVETSRIIFPLNQSLSSETLWLYVRAKIVERYSTNLLNILPQANLGINFVFQYEYTNTVTGEYFLSDYDNPDFFYGDGILPSAIHFDMFLSQASWSPLGINHQSPGYEPPSHMMAKSDGDLHVQRVVGVMKKVGIWYHHYIDLGYCIERAKLMSATYLESAVWDEEDYPYELTALILRNIQVYTEASGAYIDAVVDTVMIYGSGEAPTGTVRYWDWISNPSRVPSEFDSDRYNPPLWLDDGSIGITAGDFSFVFRTTIGTHSFHWPQYYFASYREPLRRGAGIAALFEFDRAVIDQVRTHTSNEFTDILGDGSRIDVYYTYIETIACAFGISQSLNLTNPIYLDEYVYARMRTNLNNTQAGFYVSVYTKNKTAEILCDSIEEIHVDLGKFWGEVEQVPGFGSPFSPGVPPDLTMNVHADNVTYIDIRLENVPNVLRIEKNGIPFGNDPTDEYGNPKSHWNYTDGELRIRLYSGDMSELWIDFETPFSLAWNVLIPSVAVLIACLTVAWLYRRLREL